eukprot:CAMPEP_0113600432 /NCGR_PEP_ID=MMETSP0015_2-20120614/42701_1 /TAXON_ID=2838 /ORGANISM="Odontella" /LENGTH=68 /DNA_ID=CAMNT_0000508683 /DNA_START=433 /DNA_END=635 /DNA_ORIENTATION=+ /assembly_acc=CAM_ASM_000160
MSDWNLGGGGRRGVDDDDEHDWVGGGLADASGAHGVLHDTVPDMDHLPPLGHRFASAPDPPTAAHPGG